MHRAAPGAASLCVAAVCPGKPQPINTFEAEPGNLAEPCTCSPGWGMNERLKQALFFCSPCRDLRGTPQASIRTEHEGNPAMGRAQPHVSTARCAPSSSPSSTWTRIDLFCSVSGGFFKVKT